MRPDRPRSVPAAPRPPARPRPRAGARRLAAAAAALVAGCGGLSAGRRPVAGTGEGEGAWRPRPAPVWREEARPQQAPAEAQDASALSPWAPPPAAAPAPWAPPLADAGAAGAATPRAPWAAPAPPPQAPPRTRGERPVRRPTGPAATDDGEPADDLASAPPPPAGFVDAAEDARSTFGVDVDTASYTLLRNHLARGLLPPAGAVRVEEVVNALDAGLPPPRGDAALALHVEGAPSPFGPRGAWLVRVGLQARAVARAARRPATVVLCLDTSGSMGDEGKLALVQASLRRLVAALRPIDEVALVTFAADAEVALPPTRVADADEVLAALDDLTPDGSTNVEAGLALAYEVALGARWPDGRAGGEAAGGRTVRVVLCTDGIANTGRTTADGILARVRDHVREGVTLTAIGVGLAGYGDALLERLADAGDGHYRYVDDLPEARRVFERDLVGTLEVVAKDAKLQVEVDPARVRGWRLLGYEDRALADRAFRDDRVDGGEAGAGHSVTALYELVLRDDVDGDDGDDGVGDDVPLADRALRDARGPDPDGRLLTARVRWQDPRDGAPREAAARLRRRDLARAVDDLSPRFLLAAVAAELAEVLRGSPRATRCPGALRGWAELAAERLPDDPQAAELVALVERTLALTEGRP